MDAGEGGQHPWYDLIPMIFENGWFRRLRQESRAGLLRRGFLPPYSPDLNPIEQAFAKVKHWMRMAQKRELEEAWRHVGQIVGTFNDSECANYFKNAGYASVKS